MDYEIPSISRNFPKRAKNLFAAYSDDTLDSFTKENYIYDYLSEN